MANLNPLAYTGNILGSTTRVGVVQFDPIDFSVNENGVVSLGGTGALQTINTQPPVAGNYTLAGTANQITKADTSGTTTFSLPAAITAPGSLTTTTTLASGTTLAAGTSMSATTTITAGTDLISTAGNIIANGAGKQLRIHGGAVTDFIGQATLAAGTVTVANTNIAAGDKILVSRHGINGSTALGVFNYSISAATSFTISALKTADGTTETNDISIVDYVIVRQV